MRIVILRFIFILVLALSSFSKTTWSTDLLTRDNDIFYYKFQATTPLPEKFSEVVKPLYFKTFDPELHIGYSLEEMQIGSPFNTYEEFLVDLIDKDFNSYASSTDRVIFFATQQQCKDNYENICGFCVFLPQQEKAEYYVDHIGVMNTYKRQGIGHQLLTIAINSLQAKVVALDTRIFNMPGKNFYQKEGFTQITPHPIPQKNGVYIRYVKTL